jgi:hypothetical protein
MKRFVFLLLFVSFSAGAQTFFPMKKGTVLEYKYYRGNGRKELRDEWKNPRWTRLTVEEVWGDSIANVVVRNETLDRLAADTTIVGVVEALEYGDVLVSDGEVVFDNVLWSFVPETFADYGHDDNYTATISAALSYPKAMNAGDSLPDMNYEATFYEQVTDSLKLVRQERNEGQGSLNAHLRQRGQNPIKRPLTYDEEQKVTTTKRRVEGPQRVETPAGVFECVKISYELVGPRERTLGHPAYISFRHGNVDVRYEDDTPPMIAKYVDYISPEVGLVKREKLNFRGKKAEESMVLESVK